MDRMVARVYDPTFTIIMEILPFMQPQEDNQGMKKGTAEETGNIAWTAIDLGLQAENLDSSKFPEVIPIWRNSTDKRTIP